ncbi:MAG: general secretion pathway protein GspB [Ghiorsea sp.]|nr:general secretion pathway protein GspB [Ghiorsea sp.]
MSYILDALNKAEKDRQQNTPDLTETQYRTTTLPAPKKNNKTWLLGLVFITLLWAVWFIFNPQETSLPVIQETPQAARPTPITQPRPIVEAVIKPAEMTKPIEKNIPNIMGLDESIRHQLPPIQISAHIYSDDVKKRLVIINDQVKHEQQYVGEQLQLIHITPHGIQLQYKNTLFSMSVKDQWPSY